MIKSNISEEESKGKFEIDIEDDDEILLKLL